MDVVAIVTQYPRNEVGVVTMNNLDAACKIALDHFAVYNRKMMIWIIK